MGEEGGYAPQKGGAPPMGRVPGWCTPGCCWVPGGWPKGLGSRLVAPERWAPVGWAPNCGYNGEGPTEMGTREWAPRGLALGVVPKGWAPGGGLQVGAAQGGWSQGEGHGCGPMLVGPKGLAPWGVYQGWPRGEGAGTEGWPQWRSSQGEAEGGQSGRGWRGWAVLRGRRMEHPH